jgi:hypothetical protein
MYLEKCGLFPWQVYKKMISETEEASLASAQKLMKRAEESVHRKREEEKKVGARIVCRLGHMRS